MALLATKKELCSEGGSSSGGKVDVHRMVTAWRKQYISSENIINFLRSGSTVRPSL